MPRPPGRPLPESHKTNIQRAIQANWDKRKAAVGKWKEPQCDTAVALAKRDLAQKILAVIEQTNPYLTFGSANGSMMKKCVVAELQSLFINEGINLTQQPDGGEGDG